MVTDWSKIFLKHRGQWVGFKDDEKTVIASGRSVREVVEKSEAKGFPIQFFLRFRKNLNSMLAEFADEISLS